MAVLDNMPERLIAHVTMVVMQEKRRITADHANLVDRLGMARHGVPQA